jgi:hypothetical protein
MGFIGRMIEAADWRITRFVNRNQFAEVDARFAKLDPKDDLFDEANYNPIAKQFDEILKWCTGLLGETPSVSQTIGDEYHSWEGALVRHFDAKGGLKIIVFAGSNFYSIDFNFPTGEVVHIERSKTTVTPEHQVGLLIALIATLR